MEHTKVGVHTRGDLHSIGFRKLARPGPPQHALCGQDVPTAQGSLVGAERRLGRSPAAVSRVIAFLERHVGAELLHFKQRLLVNSVRTDATG